MRFLKYVGYGWSAVIVIGYFALWISNEHGGGVLSKSGFGEIWLIALACLPGILLIKIGEMKR